MVRSLAHLQLLSVDIIDKLDIYFLGKGLNVYLAFEPFFLVMGKLKLVLKL